MPVASGTLAGVNTWTFSGVVTDAQIQTAWSALVTNGVYVINRAIYLDNTCDMTSVTGGFLVDFGTQVSPAIILHNSRDKTKSVFNNFTFLQRTGLIVSARSSFIQTTNGTTLANAGSSLSIDGLAQSGGGFVYGVVGNSGAGDSRYLNEMAYASQEGTTIYSQEFTEQELQPCVGASTQLKGITYEKCYGFPQIGTPSGNVNVVVYRSKQNTQSLANGGLIPIRLFPSGGRYASVCYVDSYITRNNADINTRLIDTFGSNASNIATIMVLNNYTRESWFGASKTNIPVTTWSATNLIYGGVLKKLQFIGGSGGVIKAYDSRSTTTPQKCSFQETGTSDFLSTNTSASLDANGRISLVLIGAIATGAGAPITRYTNQKFTYQKFGDRVQVFTPDMTSGDNDLSAFTPITPTVQAGISRPLATINAATEINNFQELLEELHVLAIGLSGEQSYSGAFNGNLFNYDGSVLTTSFTTVNVDATAASKIAFNSATNTLTIKSSVLMDTVDVTRWNNVTGTINLLNGAAIQGVYQTSAGTSTIWEFGNTESPITVGTSLVIYDASGTTKYFNAVTTEGVYRYYIAPQAVGEPYTYAIEKYGTRREEGVFPSNFGDVIGYAPRYSEDVGITETTLATVQAYTTITNSEQFFDYTAVYRLSEAGIKKGNIVSRDGTNINITGFNHVIKNDASTIYSITGDTITTKGASYEGTTKYEKEVTDFSHTIEADTTEIITILIEDANGDSSALLAGTVNNLIEVWKITNETLPKDFATGTLIDTGIGNGLYRFIHEDGFQLVFNNTDLGIVFRYCSMSKGDYQLGWYIYNIPTGGLTDEQADRLNDIYDKEVIIQNKLDTDLDVKVSTRLATADYVAPHNDEIDAIKLKVDTLENTDLTGIATATDVSDAKDEIIAELANIDVDLTGVALEATSQDIINKVDAIQTTVDNIDVDFTPVLDAVGTKPTLAEMEASTILANKTDIENAKDSIETKIDNIVVDNEAISAQVWADEPERLKQVATVETTGSQIASFNNL